ncbi:MAG: amidohydrolase family protein [Candidatus Acidiferrum sp.]|jgi:L-fuconolactonase
MPERIDAHHHLWLYRKEEHAWISGEMSAIARDFLVSDLEKELVGAGMDGSVVVQATQSLHETEWLLSLANNSERIRGVVGWAPISSYELPAALEEWRDEKKLKGLRHVIQDETDEKFMERGDFNRGVSQLAGTGLVYDILIYEWHLPAAIAFVDRHPKQAFVLDHIAKPRIRERILNPWAANVRELARRGNVYCKLSGMVTEADWENWNVEDVRPYVDVVLDAFGPARLMAGSDWPVCLLASTYVQWFDTLRDLLRPLSTSEKDLIFGGVAAKVYSLGKPAAAVMT